VDIYGLVDLLSWWTFTDIFEEGGQDSHLFNKSNGWGLLSLYEIPKPTFRAFQLLHETGNKRIPGKPDPDFYVTVGAVATNNETHMTILIWNHDVPTANLNNETVCVSVGPYTKDFKTPAYLRRIDQNHANPLTEWKNMNSPIYPTNSQISKLSDVSVMRWEDLTYTISDNMELTFQIVIPPQGVASVVIALPPTK